jgi:hypothetical protein
MMPLIPLAAVAAGAIATTYTVAIAREAKRPRRATFAWALAHGTPTDPGQVDGVRGWQEGATTLRDAAHAAAAHPAGAGARTSATPPSARSIVIPWWSVRGSGSGTLLLVHGWGRSRWDSLRRLPWLLSHAESLLLPDLRGHGEAPGTTSIGHDDHLDLVQVLADAAPDLDPSELTLVGHSMGAMVVARLAASLAASGTPVRRLVLLAPYDALIVPMANRLRLRALPTGPFATIAAAWHARGQEPLHRTLSRVRCPVLTLGGGVDAVTTPDDVRRATMPHEPVIEPAIDHPQVGVEGEPSRQALEAFLAGT